MKNCSIILTLLALFAFPLQAAEQSAQGWALYSGVFDTAKSSIHDPATEVGLEYRLAPFKIKKIEIIPAFGVAGTTDSAFWVYGSFRYDWKLSDHWLVTPQVGISLFEEGDGKDLGGLIEFRSGLEVSYRFNRGARLGLLFYHLSSAGIYTPNPGSNSLVLIWGLNR